MPARTTVSLVLALAVALSLGGLVAFHPSLGDVPGSAGGDAPTATGGSAVTAAGTGTPTEATTPTPAGTTQVTPAGSYGEATVRFVDDADGTTLAAVRVRVADTFVERYTGLSNTESLKMGQGMLFVHDEEARHAYVMRRMDFPLDMVFVAADGTVTTVHHAPVPPPGTAGGDLKHYAGRAKYVLEVPMGFTNRTGVSVGDRLVLPDHLR